MLRVFFLFFALAVSSSATAAGQQYSLHYEPSKVKGELSIEANYYLWIPENTPILRGVIVHQHGCGDGAEKGGVTASHDLHWQALAKKWNCALMGSSYRAKGGNCRLWCDPRNGSDQRFQQALADFAKKTEHPELTSVPWCLWGHSGGAFWASLMQVKHPDRIVAIWLRSGTAFGYWEKGEIAKPEIPAAAYGVPVMCNPGAKEKDDKRFRNAWNGGRAMFTAYRAKGAPIGFAPDPRTAHECGDSRYLAIPFFDACIAMRLPGIGASDLRLRPVDFGKSYYVADEKSKPVAGDAFQGDKNTASWLPADKTFVAAWTTYRTTGSVTDDSPPPKPTDVFITTQKDGSLHLSWNAVADFQSGLRGFEILRDGKPFASLPKKPDGRFGKPLFQAMSYHDTPSEPLPTMTFIVPAADAKNGGTFAVIAVNAVGLKSRPTRAKPKTVSPR